MPVHLELLAATRRIRKQVDDQRSSEQEIRRARAIFWKWCLNILVLSFATRAFVLADAGFGNPSKKENQYQEQGKCGSSSDWAINQATGPTLESMECIRRLPAINGLRQEK